MLNREEKEALIEKLLSTPQGRKKLSDSMQKINRAPYNYNDPDLIAKAEVHLTEGNVNFGHSR